MINKLYLKHECNKINIPTTNLILWSIIRNPPENWVNQMYKMKRKAPICIVSESIGSITIMYWLYYQLSQVQIMIQHSSS